MPTGVVTGQKIPAFSDRQRLDRVDISALSQGLRTAVDHVVRTLVTKLYSTNGAPVGEIWLGGDVTPNPTGPGDGKLRLNTSLFIGVDASGRILVKPQGVTQTVTIPVGTSQVYLYDQEIATELAIRRFITALPIFTEVSAVVPTNSEAGVNLYIRAGGIGTIVKEDIVGARTVPLLFLGIATNIAGAVTFDVSGQTNRLTTVTSSVPTLPTGPNNSGSISNVADFARALAYMVSRDRWLNSTHFTPSTNNNMGAYTEPPAGLDLTYRKTYQTVTVGSGTGLNKGDFDVSSYANATACLQAAINSLSSSGGGSIVIKPFASLNMTGNIIVPTNTSIRITGDKADNYVCIAFGANKITFAGVSSVFTLEGIKVSTSGTFIESNDNKLIFKCVDVVTVGNSSAAVKITGVLSDGCVFDGCNFTGSAASDSTTNTGFIDAGTTPVRNFTVDNCTFVMSSNVQRYITIGDVRSNLRIRSSSFKFGTDGTPTVTAAAIVLGTTVNSKDGDSVGRLITGCTFVGSPTNLGQAYISAVNATALSYLQIVNCDFRNTVNSLELSYNASVSGYQCVDNCIFRQSSSVVLWGLSTAKLSAFKFTNNTLDNSMFTLSVGDIEDVTIDGCVCTTPYTAVPHISVSSQTIRRLQVSNNSLNTVPNQSLSGLLCILADLSSGYIQDLLVCNNKFVGGGSTITDNIVLGAQIHGKTLDSVIIANNSFKNMQNVAYTGTANANTAGGFRVIEFRAYTVNGINVYDNQFTDIASNYIVAGAGALAFGRCIRFAPHIDATQTGSWNAIDIHDNTFGDDNGLAGPFTFDGPVTGCIALRSVTISNNMIYYQYKSGVTYPFTADMSVITHDQSEVYCINCNNNYIHPVNNTASIMSRHVLAFGPPNLSALRIQNFYVCKNIIDIWPNDFGYDVATGYGIASYYNSIKQLVFVHNSCGGTDKIRTNGFVTPSASIPAVPLAGAVWPENNFIKTKT